MIKEKIGDNLDLFIKCVNFLCVTKVSDRDSDHMTLNLIRASDRDIPIMLIFYKMKNKEETCYDLSEFGVQVDSTGQEHLHISGGKKRRPGREEDLEASDVSIDFKQRLHVFGGGNIFGDSASKTRKINSS